MIKNPVHPGKIVRDICIDATGLTVTEVAHRLAVDRTTLSRLINGKASISPEMAVRLAMALNSSPKLWLNLQRDYDLWLLDKSRDKMRVQKIAA
jgi:antitoxin HigA-1